MTNEGLPTVMVDGKPVPGYFMSNGEARVVLCTCHRDSEGQYDDGPSPACPYHGKSPYMVCDACNYDTHTCPMCGSPVAHDSDGLCDGDREYLARVEGTTSV